MRSAFFFPRHRIWQYCFTSPCSHCIHLVIVISFFSPPLFIHRPLPLHPSLFIKCVKFLQAISFYPVLGLFIQPPPLHPPPPPPPSPPPPIPPHLLWGLQSKRRSLQKLCSSWNMDFVASGTPLAALCCCTAKTNIVIQPYALALTLTCSFPRCYIRTDK